MMAAAKELEEWTAQELAEKADVSPTTAHKFGRKGDFDVRREPTAGRASKVYVLTDEAEEAIDREVSAFFQQVYEIALRYDQGSASELREAVAGTFDQYFPGVDYEYAEEPTDYGEDTVIAVFQEIK